jgi:hypothetical protein
VHLVGLFIQFITRHSL